MVLPETLRNKAVGSSRHLDVAKVGLERSTDLRRASCDLGVPEGCYNLAIAYRDGSGVVANLERAVSLAAAACNAGLSNGCGMLAKQLIVGQGIEKDVPRGLSMLRELCDVDVASACLNVGATYLEPGAGKDFATALRFNKRACDLDASMCNNLAKQYEEGWGVPKDLARAKDLYRKACKGGDPVACQNLKIIGGDP